MPIIKNYGLRWLRNKVDWGSPGRTGRLLGKYSRAKRSDNIDFREQIGVYVLYETGFAPVYIGQAGFGNADLFGRLKSHQNDHLRDRWFYFSWFGFRDIGRNGNLFERQKADARTSLTYLSALDEIEGLLIQVLEPRLNKQGAKWQRTAQEYVQVGRDEIDRLEEISLQIDNLRQAVTSGFKSPRKSKRKVD
jgi:hypothetical protein